MADQDEGPNSGHLGTAWETGVVAAFATIIVLVGVIAFYFRRRRIRHRLSARVQSPTNASRDLEQGAVRRSFEKSSEFREARGSADVDVSIAKPERAASASSPRESISSSSHYFHQTTQKQGTFGPHRYYWEPK